jgi:predicted ATP-grasp superfamily ATP-dependent carboligase
MDRQLLIVGASVRAAAFSALRAGFEPTARDMHADADLRRCCRVERIADYPRGVLRAFESAPPVPWMYTGGLENHSRLLDQLAGRRTLFGNSGAVVRRVRNPWLVAEALTSDGLDVPLVAPRDELVSRGAWLRKPRRSCGGRGIERAGIPFRAGGRRFYFQHCIEGTAASAVYVAAKGRAELVGVTAQLIGAEWTGGRDWWYCGSIGPLALSDAALGTCRRIGSCLAERFALVGLFGVDLVLDASERIWPIEVNPRYTASVEVLERAAGVPAIAAHVAACCEGRLPEPIDLAGSHDRFCGKAIVYAEAETTIGRAFAEAALNIAGRDPWPRLADIPAAGTTIHPGEPILTVLTDGENMPEVEGKLRRRAAAVRRMMNRR